MRHIVEERPELGARELGRRVRHRLHDALQVEIAGERPRDAIEDFDAFRVALAARDVARDLRCANNQSFRVLDRGDRERNVDEGAVLTAPHGLIVFDPFAATDAIENTKLLIRAIRWNQDGYRLADDLGDGIAVELFGTGIPGPDDAIQINADDAIVRGFHDRGQQRLVQRRAMI